MVDGVHGRAFSLLIKKRNTFLNDFIFVDGLLGVAKAYLRLSFPQCIDGKFERVYEFAIRQFFQKKINGDGARPSFMVGHYSADSTGFDSEWEKKFPTV